jgi:hypothetical protein
MADAERRADGVVHIPWHVEEGYGDCSGYAVVRDSDGSIEGCHETLAKAKRQLRALYASEMNIAADLSPQTVYDRGLPNGWRGPIAMLDAPTGDTRMLLTPEGGVRYRQFPMSFTREHVGEGVDKHIGTIDYAWVEGPFVMGEGRFDLDGHEGYEAARLIGSGMLFTTSIHPDEVTFEVRFVDLENEEFVEESDAIHMVTDEQGMEYPALREGFAVKHVMSDWRLASNALVSVPAFDEARIWPVWDYVKRDLEVEVSDDELDELEDDEALLAWAKRKKSKRKAKMGDEGVVAAAGEHGQVFRAESFQAPNFEGPTPLTVTEDGKVYGHVALWNSCYMQFGSNGDTCTTIKPSKTGYSRFHVHGARLEDGSVLPVGAITFGEGHRAAGGLRASQKLYADVATMAAKVVAGEDKYGVWVAGEVLDAFLDRADDLLLSPLSGHWEPDGDVGGALEMLAAHVVVTPGFKVPRLVASIGENGEIDCLVASGPFEEKPSVDLEAKREEARQRFAARAL